MTLQTRRGLPVSPLATDPAMIVPALNVPSRAILAALAPRIVVLALAAAGIAAALLAIAVHESEAPPVERPVFARRTAVLPAIVVSAPADRSGEVVVHIR